MEEDPYCVRDQFANFANKIYKAHMEQDERKAVANAVKGHTRAKIAKGKGLLVGAAINKGADLRDNALTLNVATPPITTKSSGNTTKSERKAAKHNSNFDRLLQLFEKRVEQKEEQLQLMRRQEARMNGTPPTLYLEN